MSIKKIILLVVVLGLVISFFVFDLGQYLTLHYFQSQRHLLLDYVHQHPIKAGLIYFIIYIIITGLSLPGAAILTLVGGAIFGLLLGFVLVSFASTIGATLAFIFSRYLFKDWVQKRFGRYLQAINKGVTREGGFYLFTLRLVSIFPFFVINLVMGLTPIKTRTFYWVSQVGMLAGTLVYVNAGTQLGQLTSLQGILSPALIGSFVLLGLFPLVAKKLVSIIQTKRRLKEFPRPKRFDRNLIVIGAGSAGLVSAYIAAALKAKVTLVEQQAMGGGLS